MTQSLSKKKMMQIDLGLRSHINKCNQKDVMRSSRRRTQSIEYSRNFMDNMKHLSIAWIISRCVGCIGCIVCVVCKVPLASASRSFPPVINSFAKLRRYSFNGSLGAFLSIASSRYISRRQTVLQSVTCGCTRQSRASRNKSSSRHVFFSFLKFRIMPGIIA